MANSRKFLDNFTMLFYMLRNGLCTVPDSRRFEKGSSHTVPAVDAFAHGSVHLPAGALFEFLGVLLGKLPFIKFFPADWLRDTRCLSLEARGAWIDLLCLLWESKTRGQISWPLTAFDQFLGTIQRNTVLYSAQEILEELHHLGICDLVTDGNGVVTLICRRMVREEKQRNQVLTRVKRHREASSNDSVTEKKRPILQKSDVRSHISEDKEPPISPEGFEAFWKTYPKKVGKRAALKAWDKAKLNGKVEIVLEAVEKQKTWPQWQKDGGQYIPNPATWINQGRWEDQPVEEVKEERTGVWAKKFTPEPR